MICCFSFVFSGCANKSLSINQIEEVLFNLTIIDENGLEENIVRLDNNSISNYSITCLKWSRLFERANVDAEDLRTVEQYQCSNKENTIVIAFKFKDSESAKNCYNGYDFGSDYKKQLYGKVILIVKTDYANQIFKAIGKI